MTENEESRIPNLLAEIEEHRSQGSYDEAEALASELVTESENSPLAIAILARVKKDRGEYADAIDLFERSLKSPDSSSWATPTAMAVLNLLGECYHRAGQFHEAEQSLRESMTIAQEGSDRKSVEMADALRGMALLSREKGDYRSAISQCEQALLILREQLGPAHLGVATALGQTADFCVEAGDLDRAGRLYSEADAMVQSLDSDLFFKCDLLEGWARLFSRQGRHKDAEGRLLERARLLKAHLGSRHPGYFLALRDLAGTISNQERYIESEAIYRESLAGLTEALGSRHIDVAKVMNDLAIVLDNRGMYVEAVELYSNALSIMGERFGDSHVQLAPLLTNLANLRSRQILYREAEQLYRRSLEIQTRAFGSKHANVALCKINLAGALRGQTRFVEAELLQQEGIEGLRQALGADHEDVGKALHELAVLRLLQGSADAAKDPCTEALAIAERSQGVDDAGTVYAWETLAAIARHEGRNAEAEEAYRRALGIAEARWGPENPGVASLLTSLAELFAGTARPAQAFEFLRRAIILEQRIVGESLASTSEEQRLQYRGHGWSSVNTLLSLVCQSLLDSHDAIRFAFDLVSARKGMVAETMMAQREAVLAAHNSHLHSELDRLAQLRQNTSRLALSLAHAVKPVGNPQDLIRQLEEKQQLETRLARVWGKTIHDRLDRASTETVAAALTEGWTLLEFVRFEEQDFSEPRVLHEPGSRPAAYAAFILKARRPESIALVRIPEAGKIDALVVKLRSQIADEKSNPNAVQTTIRELGSALLSPLLPQLAGCLSLFVAPDADLNVLPFEILAVDDNREILADRCDIAYVSAARDILRFNAPAEPSTAPVVIASPDFDYGAEAGDPPEPIFDPLDGALREGDRVAALLEVPLMSGAAATADTLLRQVSPSILVLSTHAYFLPDRFFDAPRHSAKDADAMVFADLRSRGLPNPMWRSGLAFAGANTFLAGQWLPAEVGPGIVTAEEVCALNLAGNQLTVLAACETGLGAVQHGEGIFGLRRAFAIAGARAMLLSLWKVDDAPTSFLIERFFSYLLLEKQGRVEALRRARNDLRYLTIAEALELPQWKNKQQFPSAGALSAYRPFENPYYWAAFVLQGDPRALPEGKQTKEGALQGDCQ